jgi:hypothetical protein
MSNTDNTTSAGTAVTLEDIARAVVRGWESGDFDLQVWANEARAALAQQPAAQPVAWMFPGDEVTAPHVRLIEDGEVPPGTVLLYAAAPAAAQPVARVEHSPAGTYFSIEYIGGKDEDRWPANGTLLYAGAAPAAAQPIGYIDAAMAQGLQSMAGTQNGITTTITAHRAFPDDVALYVGAAAPAGEQSHG